MSGEIMEAEIKKAALITGAAKRLGSEIAIALAVYGYDIALHYNSSEQDAIITQKKIRNLGRDCSLFKGDLKDNVFLSELIRGAYSAFPHISVLINSASVFKRASISDTSPVLLDELFSVNFKAPFFLTKEFALICRTGCVINIIDTKMSRDQNVYSGYILSQIALNGFTRLAAKEFSPDIRVNGICPGLILPGENEDDEYISRLKAKIPLAEKGNPGNITASVKFLIDNDFITGEVIFVDGGEHLK